MFGMTFVMRHDVYGWDGIDDAILEKEGDKCAEGIYNKANNDKIMNMKTFVRLRIVRYGKGVKKCRMAGHLGYTVETQSVSSANYRVVCTIYRMRC